MRIFLLLIFFIITSRGLAQEPARDMDLIRELNLVYSDTVNGKSYIGDYEPTGAIPCRDGGYLISTILSIDFPEQHDTTDLTANFEKYYERSKLYSSKAHISSGSVLKLNKDLNKVWEVIFKDKRVTHIIPFDTSSFIIAGERVQQNTIWIAKLDVIGGKVHWLKEFDAGYDLSTSGLAMLNEKLYILGETERMIPVKVTKRRKKVKIALFKKTQMEMNLILLCVSKDGNLEWKRKIDPRKNYHSFGYKLISKNKNHFILASHTGYKKIKNEHVKDEIFAFYTLKTNGKIQSKAIVSFNAMLYLDTAIVFTKTNYDSDNIKVFKFSNTGISQTDSFLIPSDKKRIRVISVLKSENLNYLFGSMQSNNKDYLVCSMSHDYKIIECRRHDKPDYNEIVSLMETPDKNLLLIGWCYKRDVQTGNLYKYMNLIKFRKFGE